ncbi:glutaredoxin family protein [Catenulispora yoronensis]|uniref:Glutaredoxin family protein n=1 Tax=Catenulispora yoronensis TaxID=450799 RepID=A0ABN2VN57_9ACTN
MLRLFKRSGAAPVTVTLVGKPGCHLCDDARRTVREVAAETGADVEELDITAPDFDPALKQEYWEQIPVTLVNGARHDFWRVDAERLRKAIAAAARG